MMAYTYTHTRLLVTDMAASVRFYRDILGFKVNVGGENDVYTDGGIKIQQFCYLFSSSICCS